MTYKLVDILKELKIVGFDSNTDSLDKTPASIKKWYDRKTRSWVVMLLNKDGDQVGDADYVATRLEADLIVKDYKKRYNINLSEAILYDREDMPQVDDIPDDITKMKMGGVEINKGKMKPSDMKNSQTTIDMEKVKNIAKTIDPKTMKPIVVSMDNHIVDGHHRWKALEHAGYSNDKVSVYIIKLNRRMAIKKYNDVAHNS